MGRSNLLDGQNNLLGGPVNMLFTALQHSNRFEVHVHVFIAFEKIHMLSFLCVLQNNKC